MCASTLLARWVSTCAREYRGSRLGPRRWSSVSGAREASRRRWLARHASMVTAGLIAERYAKRSAVRAWSAVQLIGGTFDPRFGAVHEAFVANFDQGEIGAACAITIEGRLVVDLRSEEHTSELQSL